MKLHDLTGIRSGRLLVLRKAPSRAGVGYWLCQCDCGRQVEIRTSCLIRKRPYRSCNCLRNEMNKIRNRTHGLKGTRIHRIWTNMKTRCYNEKSPSFKNYGAKGIRVCRAWRKSFQAFLDYMGPLPGPDYVIGRIRHDKNYEPGNCRWITGSENSIERLRGYRPPSL
jgi:hypothetical protein